MSYYADQVPTYTVTAASFQPQGLVMTMQLGNVFLLLAFIALICVWTPHPEVARYYCLAVGLADWGHIYSTYRGVGHEYFFNPSGWSDMIWGNVGVSVFLNVIRFATVAGVFGNVGGSDKGKAKRV